MSIKEIIKQNLNKAALLKQKKNGLILLGSILVVLIIGWSLAHKKSDQAPSDTASSQAKLSGPIGEEFTENESQVALQQQQREIKELYEKLDKMGAELKVAQEALSEKLSDPTDLNTTIGDLQVKVSDLEESLNKAQRGGSPGQTDISHGGGAQPISAITFSYQDGTNDIKKTPKNYVPAGSFVRAVLLNGADTNAGVHGQADTSPVTMRILDNGTLPNGSKSSLKGCFLVAAAYGDASSERGQIRLQRLSCVRKGKQVLDIPVEGTVNDMGGSDGIRGHVVMRNNKLIFNAGVAGVLSGMGSAMKQTLTTQVTSPLGVNTQSIIPNNAWKYGAVGGVDSAFSKLADYYIKLAEMYHPIVQVHAGSEVTVVFLKGFSLNEGIIEEKNPVNRTNSQEPLPENLTKTLKTAEVGDEVSATN